MEEIIENSEQKSENTRYRLHQRLCGTYLMGLEKAVMLQFKYQDRPRSIKNADTLAKKKHRNHLLPQSIHTAT